MSLNKKKILRRDRDMPSFRYGLRNIQNSLNSRKVKTKEARKSKPRKSNAATSPITKEGYKG